MKLDPAFLRKWKLKDVSVVDHETFYLVIYWNEGKECKYRIDYGDLSNGDLQDEVYRTLELNRRANGFTPEEDTAIALPEASDTLEDQALYPLDGEFLNKWDLARVFVLKHPYTWRVEYHTNKGGVGVCDVGVAKDEYTMKALVKRAIESARGDDGFEPVQLKTFTREEAKHLTETADYVQPRPAMSPFLNWKQLPLKKGETIVSIQTFRTKNRWYKRPSSGKYTVRMIAFSHEGIYDITEFMPR